MLNLFKKLKKLKFLNFYKEESKNYEALPEIKEFIDSIGEGYWNYRIMQLEYKDEYGHEKWYEMREVYYDENDNIWAWSAGPKTFSVESIEDIKHLKEQVALAMIKPILAIKKNKDGNEYIKELKRTIYEIRRKK